MKEQTYLDFEKPIAELESKIEALRHTDKTLSVNISEEIATLNGKLEKQFTQLYRKLSPWQKAQVARHPARPHCVDYLSQLIEDFTPLAGDRRYAEDAAIIAGIGRFQGYSVAVIGQEKGHDIETRIKHNFGMPKPEGYRKSQRIMEMADRFNLPILTFVDTAGAYPGVEAEARGQAEAIAASIQGCLNVSVPLISCVIGEGGSGGAIALATANSVLMLEHSIYSVISPEGCASILWRTGEKASAAAEALNMTAQDLLRLGVIDEIIPEPLGGAHRNPTTTVQAVGQVILKHLLSYKGKSREMVKQHRFDKFKQMTRLQA